MLNSLESKGRIVANGDGDGKRRGGHRGACASNERPLFRAATCVPPRGKSYRL